MTLFAASSGASRLAVFAGHEFPLAAHSRIYERMDGLAAALGARWRFVHEVAGDPATLGPDLRARCGTGLLCPQDRLQHRNDVEHLRATVGTRFDALVDTLREIVQCSRAALIVRPEFQAAASVARWTRGYAPHLIVSFGLGEAAMQALFAAALLDVPRVHVLDTLDGHDAFGLLLPLHVQQSALLVAAGDGIAAALRQRYGTSAVTRTFELAADGGPSPTLRHALHGLAATNRSASHPPLGATAAFRTAHLAGGADAPGAPRALLLLSAERTGSNMLRGSLDASPGVRCAGELFNRRDTAVGRVDWLDGATEDPALHRLRLADPAALHAQLLADGAARGAGTVGCKLLYGHGVVDDRIVDHFASRQDLVVVHLLRRDRLRRHLSLARALRSDRWFATAAMTAETGDGEARDQHAPLELAPRDLAADFTLVEQFEARYRALFAAQQPLECTYEQLAHEPGQVLAALAERLGGTLPLPQLRSRKTGGDAPDTAIANFAALRAAFRGTRWSSLFETDASDQLEGAR